MESTDNELESPETPPEGRRSFLKGAAAALLGGAATLVAPIAGLRVFLQPWRGKTQAGNWVRVATLRALPTDGIPRRFPVVSDQINAWTRVPQVPVGAVFLRRTGDQSAEAFSVICPHAGCQVDFRPSAKSFLCPCHNSTFAIDGKINDPRSPSPRGLDSLEVRIRENDEVWVRLESFRPGAAEKIRG